jgi:hypothetical protein
MEYWSNGKVPEFKKDKRYQLEAYETIYTAGAVRGWEDKIAQFDYHILHRLVVRPLSKKLGEPTNAPYSSPAPQVQKR